MSERVVIVDVGVGNLRSVEKAVAAAGQELGLVPERSADLERIRKADRLIVPGQGEFSELLRRLGSERLDLLKERIRAGTPYFGICVGMQILFSSSEEASGVAGMGVLPGTVRRLQGGGGVKIPHMGWNQLELRAQGHPFLEAGSWFCFMHSYHCVPSEPGLVRAVAEYGPNQVTAAVARDNVFATQFHPEKSQRAGLSLLGRFLRA
jgi:glutamine amidotransferase